ncbi:MAG: hypothetical protein OXH65_05925, partial [Paracoccaceae bacterium]|nr:hypothetical protein [Paracoccaceae bacterium]MDE2674631.1 hypothetical protein [Paracoccaceae bacterium]
SGSFGDTSYRITAADPGIDVPALVRVTSETDDTPSDTGTHYTKANYDAHKSAMDKNNDWSVGVSHSINTISVGVGMDSESGLAIGVSTDLSGVTTSLYWSKSEMSDVLAGNLTHDIADDVKATQEYTGLGVKASMSAGEGATFSVGYSTQKLEQNGAQGDDSTTGVDVNYDGTATTKLIEVDFSYDLGGGATLKAGIDKKDAETLEAGTGDNKAMVKSTDTTTLEAAIAFSF